MKFFKLELRVYHNNTRSWQVFLERISDEHKIGNWSGPSEGRDYFSKTWIKYGIDDDCLEVFLACTGYGGSAKCEVLINDARPSKKNTVFANFDDKHAAVKKFIINDL